MTGHRRAIATRSLASLTEQCAQERSKFHARQEADPAYCYEIIRRALTANDDGAWTAFHDCFYQDVRRWVLVHPAAPTLLQREAAEIYVEDAFVRLYQANHNKPIDVSSLPTVLGFLRRCVNSTMLDAVRAARRDPAPIHVANQIAAPDELGNLIDSLATLDLWRMVEQCLTTVHEQRLARLLWIEGYKPRELPVHFPELFPTIQDVRRTAANIIERLRRRYRP
jgi:DNA-directed RNA polymerase specialized sigma24 family protein